MLENNTKSRNLYSSGAGIPNMFHTWERRPRGTYAREPWETMKFLLKTSRRLGAFCSMGIESCKVNHGKRDGFSEQKEKRVLF